MTLPRLHTYALFALALTACSGDSGGTDTDATGSTSAGSTSTASTSASSTTEASSTTADTAGTTHASHGGSSSTSASTTDATTDATGTTGGGATFPCGNRLTCDVATQYCEVIHPGQPDGMITYACQPIPDACLDMADCACLMEQMIMGDCSVTPEGGLKVLFFAP